MQASKLSTKNPTQLQTYLKPWCCFFCLLVSNIKGKKSGSHWAPPTTLSTRWPSRCLQRYSLWHLCCFSVHLISYGVDGFFNHQWSELRKKRDQKLKTYIQFFKLTRLFYYSDSFVFLVCVKYIHTSFYMFLYGFRFTIDSNSMGRITEHPTSIWASCEMDFSGVQALGRENVCKNQGEVEKMGLGPQEIHQKGGSLQWRLWSLLHTVDWSENGQMRQITNFPEMEHFRIRNGFSNNICF